MSGDSWQPHVVLHREDVSITHCQSLCTIIANAAYTNLSVHTPGPRRCCSKLQLHQQKLHFGHLRAAQQGAVPEQPAQQGPDQQPALFVAAVLPQALIAEELPAANCSTGG